MLVNQEKWCVVPVHTMRCAKGGQVRLGALLGPPPSQPHQRVPETQKIFIGAWVVGRSGSQSFPEKLMCLIRNMKLLLTSQSRLRRAPSQVRQWGHVARRTPTSHLRRTPPPSHLRRTPVAPPAPCICLLQVAFFSSLDNSMHPSLNSNINATKKN